MLIHIGSFVYVLLSSCGGQMGYVHFPLTDAGARTMCVERTLPRGQQREVFFHELEHACLHNHQHNFGTKAQMQKHMDATFGEEEVAESVGHCLATTPSLTDLQEWVDGKH